MRSSSVWILIDYEHILPGLSAKSRMYGLIIEIETFKLALFLNLIISILSYLSTRECSKLKNLCYQLFVTDTKVFPVSHNTAAMPAV